MVMNKKILFAIVGLLIVIGAAATYLLASPAKLRNSESTLTASSESSTDQITSLSDTADPPASTEPKAVGAYINYQTDSIAKTSGTKLLYFHAPWCPQCRQLEADIKASGVPSGVTIIKVDYDSSQALRRQYGVTLQTTLVKIDDAGQEIKKYVAYDDPSIASVIKALL